MLPVRWRRSPSPQQQPPHACCCVHAETYAQAALQRAACRAVETHLPHALVHDACADAFISSAMRERVQWGTLSYVQTILQCRYRQDFVCKFLSSSLCYDGRAQLVALGAALDVPRAGGGDGDGCAAPVVNTFELELPQLVSLKRRALSECAHVPRAPDAKMVALDAQRARVDWPVQLLANGFDTCVHTVWLLDYTSPLLREVRLESLLNDVRALSRPGSVLLLHLCRRHHAHLLSHARRVFRSLAFVVMDVDVVGDGNASYGRWCFDTPSSSAFITASKNCI